MSESQNVVVSETTRSSIIPNNRNNNNNSSSSQKPPTRFISISKKKLLKNIDIINAGGQRINAWVDSMRASSPTHLKSISSSISLQQQLNSWIVSRVHIYNTLSQSFWWVFLLQFVFSLVCSPTDATSFSNRNVRTDSGSFARETNRNVSWLWWYSLSHRWWSRQSFHVKQGTI